MYEIFGEYGIATDLFSWLTLAGLIVFWVASLLVCTSVRTKGWVAVPTSLFGLAWLGFGLDMVLRFFIIRYDSVAFGNGSLRLAELSSAKINEALLLLNGFWILFSVAFFVVSRRNLSSPFNDLKVVTPELVSRMVPISVPMMLACIYLSQRGVVPSALVTPLALFGSMWVIPASVLWWRYFSGAPSKRKTSYRDRFDLFLVLTPGMFYLWLSPYREIALTILLVPFSALLFSGRRLRLSVVVFFCLVVLIVSTVMVHSYRQVVWMREAVSDLVFQVEDWKEYPIRGPLAEPLRRFHALDSLLLTVDLVPATFPYREDDLIVGSVIRGVVPRLLYTRKIADDRAVKFGETIWSFGDVSSRSAAAISPSMPGDLFGSGGLRLVFLGAILWGVLLGAMESWKNSLPLFSKASIVSLFGFFSAAAIERDFGHTISTAIQILIVLSVFSWMIRELLKSNRFAPDRKI